MQDVKRRYSAVNEHGYSTNQSYEERKNVSTLEPHFELLGPLEIVDYYLHANSLSLPKHGGGAMEI